MGLCSRSYISGLYIADCVFSGRHAAAAQPSRLKIVSNQGALIGHSAVISVLLTVGTLVSVVFEFGQPGKICIRSTVAFGEIVAAVAPGESMMSRPSIRGLLPVGGTGSADRIGDVVFVHGLDGQAEASWSAGKDKFWPQWLADDCPDVGVWSIGYDAASSGWQGTSLPLFDRAVNLLELLNVHGLGGRPLCFIAHSMGGLLVKKMVQEACVLGEEYSRLARMICGALFLATPHTGSDLAKLDEFLRFLRPTVSVHELRAQEPQLRDLNIWYRNHSAQLGIRNKVYFETRQTKGIIVVDAVAADPGIAGVIPIPIDASHVDISKPESRGEIVYLGARNFVREVLFSKKAPPASSGEPLSPANLAGLPSEQAEMLRDAISAIDKFLGVDKRFSVSYAVSPGLSTTVLLSLPPLGEQLEELANFSVTTWPVPWVTSTADAAVQAQDSLRRLRQRVYPGPHCAHDIHISTSYERELEELRCSIKRLRDLITSKYSILCIASRWRKEAIKCTGEYLIKNL